jgi:hypothetical protein
MNKRVIIVFALWFSWVCAQDTLIQWEPEVNLTQDSVVNLYPWVVCRDNYVHLVWAQLDNAIYYQRSTDFGTTWSPSYRLHDDTTVVLYPKLALGGQNVYCIWDAGYAGAYHLRFRRSTDYGGTWGSLASLDDSVLSSRSMVVARGDTVVTIAGCLDTSILFCTRRSLDGGVNWSSRYPIVKVAPLYYPGLFYINGVLHCAFTAYDTLFYLYSTNLGETWSVPIHITDPPVADAVKCRNVVANEYGRVFVPWEDNKYSGGTMDDVFLCRSTDNGLTWLTEQQMTTHHLARYWDDICCADSDVYIVWPKGGTEDALQFCASTDLGETWWPIEDLVSNPGGADDILEPTLCCESTKIHIVWRGYYNGEADIYYKRGTRCPVGITEKKGVYQLQNTVEVFPNPFVDAVRFSLSSLTEETIVRIYDISGKEVTLINVVGRNYVLWDGRDKQGMLLPAGVYFCEIGDGRTVYLQKVIKL